jgi:hypothetical protein
MTVGAADTKGPRKAGHQRRQLIAWDIFRQNLEVGESLWRPLRLSCEAGDKSKCEGGKRPECET